MIEIIGLVLSFLNVVLVYKAYETSGKGRGFLVRIVFYLLSFILGGGIKTLFSALFPWMLIAIAIAFVMMFVLNELEYLVFKNVRSFVAYFFLCLILEIIVEVARTYLFEWLITIL